MEDLVGKRCTIIDENSFFKGDCGVIDFFDGELYHVMIDGDFDTFAFERDAICILEEEKKAPKTKIEEVSHVAAAKGTGKTILVIDACVRQEESRTRKLMEVAIAELKSLHPDWNWEILNLMEEDLHYWTTETLKERDAHLMAGEYDHPMFRYGNQFREADGVIVAAPFWDLSIPAVLKVYIENISADQITFGCGEDGLKGICHGEWMLFLTTRGAAWEGSPMEHGIPYMKSMSEFFGIDRFYSVHADNLDIVGMDHVKLMEDAVKETINVCHSLA